MSTSSATGIVVAEIHAQREQSPDDDNTTTSRQPSATAAAARLPPEGPSVSRSTCKLGGSRRPQSPTVNCLPEESDIASYFVDICLMFASLIQLKIINKFCVLMVNLN